MLMEARKRCSRCRQDKPVSQFYGAAATFDDLRADCKACSAAKCRAKRAANKLLPRDRAGGSKRCERCRDVFPVANFHRDAGSTDGLYRYCRQCGVLHARASRYGLTRERVCEMLQQRQCEACGVRFSDDSEKRIDHRHSDGAVRGILCDRCNTTLGKCEESPAILMGICRYLSQTQGVDYRTQPYLEQNVDSPATSNAESFPPEGTADTCQTNTTNHPISPQP